MNSLPKLRTDQVFSIILCILLVTIHGGLEPPAIEADDSLQEILLLKPAPIPVVSQPFELIEEDCVKILQDSGKLATKHSDTSQTQFNITAQAFIVQDLASATVLAARRPQQQLFPASTVKLMTALVAKDIYPLDQAMLTTSGINTLGNKVGLLWGGQMTVADLLAAILINSGNDAALVLAHHHPNGYEGFIQQMNLKAQQLSLHQTTFANPTGIDDYNQLSTAWDLALLAKEALKDPLLADLVQSSQATIYDPVTMRTYLLNNTNQLLFEFDQAKGVKTGTTILAQQVLVTLWQENDHQLLIVVMGSTDRYQDTLRLVEWVREQVSWHNWEELRVDVHDIK